MRYIAKGQRNRHFELLDEEENVLGRIDHDGWFLNKANITIHNMVYEMSAVNFWQNKIEVSTGDIVVAELKFNWAGNIIIELAEGGHYLLKPNFWHSKYTLYTQEEKGIITLQSDFKWSSMSFIYDIEADDNYAEGRNVLLLLMLIYSYQRIRRSSYVAT